MKTAKKKTIKSETQLDKINARIESITSQYNDAVQMINKYTDIGKKCLGAIEVLNDLKEDLDSK